MSDQLPAPPVKFRIAIKREPMVVRKGSISATVQVQLADDLKSAIDRWVR
jgi:hypothetical protein